MDISFNFHNNPHFTRENKKKKKQKELLAGAWKIF